MFCFSFTKCFLDDLKHCKISGKNKNQNGISIRSYVLANSDTVVLGGTKYLDDWNREFSEADAEKILSSTRQLVPSLKEATLVKHWVGLRPSRRKVRIEREVKRWESRH